MDPEPAIPPRPWAPKTPAPRRRAAPNLDREQVVAAALGMVDRDGLDEFSVRRLATQLGVTPMALYWHVADRSELLELVGHAVLAEVVLPPRDGNWRVQLRDVHRALLVAVLRHPNTADLLVGRARYGPHGIALFETILEILLEAGFTPETAFDAYQSLYLFTLGFTATASRSPAFVEVQRQGLGYLLSLPTDRFGAIRAVAPHIGRRSLDEQMELGLDIVIEGIAARLPRP
ncbi:MAG TPA: TetR/AcrR family transcriptional regulator C-terminal domain-containing protein [Candidatus Limnocylindrales bacterium]|jgi:AcrR family transcriptional regulator